MRTIAIVAISVVCSVAAIGIIELLVYGPEIFEVVEVISGEKLVNEYGEEISTQKYILIPILIDINGSSDYLVQYKEEPKYLSECTTLAKEIDALTKQSYNLRGEEQMASKLQNHELRLVFASVCGFAGVGPGGQYP